MKIIDKIKILYRKFIKEKIKSSEEEINFDKLVNDNVEQLKIEDKEEKEKIKRKWRDILIKNSEKYGKFSKGNKVKIYNDGLSAYSDILKSINKSKKRVWLEAYIFDDSKLAEVIVNNLCEASKRGCDVILLIDYIGSLKMKSKWVNQLKENNVNVIFFNTFLNSFLNMLPIFFRDHRKIIIVDNCAYCGSMNVSENVIPNENFDEKDNKKKSKCLEYYDLHIKIKGPSVKDLADVFIDSLKMTKSSIIRHPIEKQKMYLDDNSCFIQILESNVLRKVKSIQSTFDYIIKNAANNIYITTSYFLPPGFLRRALFSALSNGVNISFLFSGNSDIFGDVPATYYIMKKFLKKYHKNNSTHEYNKIFINYLNLRKNLYYKNFLRNLKNINQKKKRKNKGVNKFYFFQKKHCHAKNLVVDNLWCAIGSFNWDRFSSRRNLEVMVSIFDKKVCDKFIKEHQNKIKDDSIEITLPHITNRNVFQIFMSYCAYHLGKLSGRNLFDGLSNNSKKTILRKAIINKYLNDNCIQNISLNMMWGV
ncbi:mitochondrial cardiolipin synthase, putative [Plasmodium gallinaceum]|uniref:Mitochondrial cardiolipin synthase, putative n=1 Tax=Plasmodium gallinaceum TaxID=5849 RepID=A0A1J1GMW8_PLAGA|nr:mitochondrial cardiolipin synthase, putative [Plasmodium gallinaceum]CRG93675.1 mitochondrial cardiolipin synthase, putative [Plasmodium gallinaceum]